jgi:hypothetical protein
VLSTEVVESGPFTTLEQAMIATTTVGAKPLADGFGRYNAVAAAAGSLGALAAVPHPVRRGVPAGPFDQRYFLVLTTLAVLGADTSITRLTTAWCGRLTGLLSVDSFGGGGFVVQAFLVYWPQERYAASATLAAVVISPSESCRPAGVPDDSHPGRATYPRRGGHQHRPLPDPSAGIPFGGSS